MTSTTVLLVLPSVTDSRTPIHRDPLPTPTLRQTPLPPTHPSIHLSPILFPMLGGMGVDPIHFGVVMVLNLVLGMVTPPVGLTLFVMARIGGVGVMALFWAAWPFFLVLVAVLLLLTYVPWLSIGLVQLLMR